MKIENYTYVPQDLTIILYATTALNNQKLVPKLDY